MRLCACRSPAPILQHVDVDVDVDVDVGETGRGRSRRRGNRTNAEQNVLREGQGEGARGKARENKGISPI